jgi:cell division septation protein DedD
MSSGAVPSATTPVSTTAPEGSPAGAAAVPGPSVAPVTGQPDVRTGPVASPAPAREAPPTTVAGPTVAATPAAGEPTRPAEPGPAASASGGWAVQVGAFGSVDAARKLARDLNGAGYHAFVSPIQRGGKTLHRVRVGPESERAGAEQLVPRLKARGLPATVVQND